MTTTAEREAADGLLRLSVLTCPVCGGREGVEMPDAGRVHAHDCTGCGSRLTAPEGACCVFCAFGTVPCPPVQKAGRSCCGGD